MSPYGARKQPYKVNLDGRLVPQKSTIYLEAGIKNRISGMEFLFKKPTTETEKIAFKKYISEIESNYKATFVYEDQAQGLIKVVKKILHEKIETETKHWQETEWMHGIKM